MTVKSLVMMSKLRAAVLGNRCTLAHGADVAPIDLQVTRGAGLNREEALWTSP